MVQGGQYVGLGKARAVPEDTFVWALECVLSRAFKRTCGTGTGRRHRTAEERLAGWGCG